VFTVGDVVGAYTVLAHLRSGGMADLYLARREGAAGFRRLVAIKVVHPRHAQDEQLVRMFLDEALLSARIDHPNVVHVEDLGQFDDTYFLVMEYVHGCSLAQLMRVLGQMHRRLSPLVAVAVAARVAEGLHAAHETTDDDGNLVSLVHRDVSPQNILLSHKGHVKLIDFGVAKARLRSEETNVAMLKGKVRYMAPEQATTGLVDRRSDVYSLGIVLWEMLTMRRLFAGKTEFEVLLKVRDPKIVPPSRYAPDIPAELDRVVLAALARDPDARPQNAKFFRRMLAQALPKALALDSAHLADLLLSIVGQELEQIRHDLPQEVSRVLQAEHLRVTGLEKEERSRPGSRAPTTSAVEVMTAKAEVAAFDVDELDDTPEVGSSVGTETRPGRPQAMGKSAPTEPDPGNEEDADPTMVGGVPEQLRSVLRDPTPSTSVDDEGETPPAFAIPVGALGPPPAWASSQGDAPPSLEEPVSQTPRWPYILAGAAAVLLFLAVGGVLWALLRDDPPVPPATFPPPESPAIQAPPPLPSPPAAPLAPVDAGAPALDAATSVDAGTPVDPAPRRNVPVRRPTKRRAVRTTR
jgi:serine/threonine-protein kinase